MWFSNNQFWIGRHTELNIYVVIKRQDVEKRQNFYLDVLYLDDYQYTRCVREFLRGQIENVSHVPKEVSSENWHFIFEESKNNQIKENHADFLKSQNIRSLGSRVRRESLPPRVTHCWSCKDSLDSTIDLECCGCGWILCACGACGCGFEKN